MMTTTDEKLPYGWPDSAAAVPLLAASPDALIAHMVLVKKSEVAKLRDALSAGGHPSPPPQEGGGFGAVLFNTA
jgi:hypothetical protein